MIAWYNQTRAKAERRYYLIRDGNGEVESITSHKWMKLDDLDFEFKEVTYQPEEITKVEYETYREFGIRRSWVWWVTKETALWFPGTRWYKFLARVKHRIDWLKAGDFWFWS